MIKKKTPYQMLKTQFLIKKHINKHDVYDVNDINTTSLYKILSQF